MNNHRASRLPPKPRSTSEVSVRRVLESYESSVIQEKTLFADSGYQGPKFAKALAKVLPYLDIEIVKRSDQVSGFVILPKRWIVERTTREPCRPCFASASLLSLS